MWCTGFREVRWMQPERIGKGAMPPRVRVCTELGLAQLQRVLRGRALVYLPEARGAGPCGTLARASRLAASSLAWSLQHIVPALARYYAAQELTRSRYGQPGGKRGLKYGARSGGGHGREALW